MPKIVPKCNKDCFNCIFPDCVYNGAPTQKESDMLRYALDYGQKGKRKKNDDNGGRWSD